MKSVFRISEAASLLGVSDDTIRRWNDIGRLPVHLGDNGRQLVKGTDLVKILIEENSTQEKSEPFALQQASTRNRIVGIITAVNKDGIMAQIDLQAGPFRLVSLMSREAADDLALEPGMVAVASAKSTNVAIELPLNK